MIKMIMMKVDGGRKMNFFYATEEGAIVRVQKHSARLHVSV